jgi:hypothetical protein
VSGCGWRSWARSNQLLLPEVGSPIFRWAVRFVTAVSLRQCTINRSISFFEEDDRLLSTVCA